MPTDLINYKNCFLREGTKKHVENRIVKINNREYVYFVRIFE